MDRNSNKNDNFEEDWSEISSVLYENNELSDKDRMNEGVSFSMIVDMKNKTPSKPVNTSDSLSNFSRSINVKPKLRDSISSISVPNNLKSPMGNFADDSDDDIFDTSSTSYNGINNSTNSNSIDDFDDSVQQTITAVTPPNPFTCIQTRTLLRWVDDAHVSRCGICNERFRMFLRRHHCIAKNTAVTMMNGMARKIQDVPINTRLPSWDYQNGNVNITNGYNDDRFDQGYEPCMEIVLEDARNLIATSDHEVLTVINNKIQYTMMKDLTTNHRVVCSLLDGVLDEPELDTVDYIIPGTTLSIVNNRDQCLEYSQKCGSNLNNVGFLFDRACPKSLKREFIASLFGNFGTVDIQNNTVRIPPIFPTLIEHILNIFGIEYSVNELYIGIIDIRKYHKTIGVRNSIDKLCKLTLLSTNSIEYNLKDRYAILRITDGPKSYKNGEPVHVYDLSVPNYVSFVANGIVVHNCRKCGQVFCGTCSDNWDTIPECITHIPSTDGLKSDIDRNTKVRLCNKCYDQVKLVKKLEILLKSAQSVEMDIFAFKAITDQKSDDLSDSFIQKINDIPEIDTMGDTEIIKFTQSFMNGKLWVQLANFYLSKFREIQYKLFYQEYTEWEKNALWTNYKYLKDHDNWVGHTLRAFKDDPSRLKVVTEYYFKDNSIVKDRDACWERMCTRLCQPELSWEMGLMLLDTVSNKDVTNRDIITNQIVGSFDRASDNVFINILVYINYHLIYSDLNEILIGFVMDKCAKSIVVTNQVYWALMVAKPDNPRRCDYLITKLFRVIPKQIYEDIVKINNFAQSIEDNYQGETNADIPIKDLDKIGTCVSPTHPDMGEQIVNNIVLPGEKSASRPVPIILTDNNGCKNVELYKREDLRTDMVVMSIIRLMHEILKESMDIDLHVITYNIQPITKDTGFIGAVNDCDTLYTIEETMKLSLANYIKKHNPNTPTKELHERFLRSCAFYTVVTFLLGIGDRHLDNMMLTKNGEFFHIDYGFVLGKDPRPMKIPYTRITAGMADAIGGYHSDEYKEFKDLCYDIYDILRRHVNTFVILLSLLPKQNTGGTWTNPKISDNRVLREIVKRFAPGSTSEQAKTILNTKIEKSTNIAGTGKGYIIDFFHRHNKEATVQNLLSYTVGSTYSGTKSMMSGIWNYVSGSE